MATSAPAAELRSFDSVRRPRPGDFDYDNDGDQDLAIFTKDERIRLFRNDLASPDRHCLGSCSTPAPAPTWRPTPSAPGSSCAPPHRPPVSRSATSTTAAATLPARSFQPTSASAPPPASRAARRVAGWLPDPAPRPPHRPSHHPLKARGSDCFPVHRSSPRTLAGRRRLRGPFCRRSVSWQWCNDIFLVYDHRRDSVSTSSWATSSATRGPCTGSMLGNVVADQCRNSYALE